MPKKLTAGTALPAMTVPRLGGGDLTLGTGSPDWQMVVVYRGKHCPICHTYLTGLQELLPTFAAAGVEVVAVSADPEDKAQAIVDELGLTLPVGYGLTPAQMIELGIYVSQSRKDSDPGWPFAEPALFVVDQSGALNMIDQSNMPFARPDLAAMAKGIAFVRSADYPLRGTYPD
ncbi:redoxin domain-containing protein [Pseudoruegeria sp. SK021]|uniref:redoxin domain-containing protein n=1 Tax=Pseudoruegeria sp. SK021 TaxID=1933035 RepID=UPI000A2576BB|nr:redoxin domain-containing protein [Pseudoruegeria sp. SK021]OSP54994.1 thioredoxin peroxidase [Pseudoruegeria sp. SK021]